VVGSERGAYGRLVGYIEAGSESGASFDFGGRMIADGFAHAYDGGGRFPHERRGYYDALEGQARATSAGLWGEHATATSGSFASLDG
jgi:endonuclease YncB( thermonuclease family)